MPRLTRIYTRTGDDGSTALGTGERVPKDDPQVEAYGTIDELNAAIGLALAQRPAEAVATELRRIQSELLNLGAVLSTLGGKGGAGPAIADAHVDALEAACDRLNAELGPLRNFILPGGTPAAAALHVARTVCRRAERAIVSLSRQVAVPDVALRYVNRLSDLLFIMARYENRERGVADVLWDTEV
ncbi:MAG: cob(I)yrinic acid a,c-diamide adenosyltransferase [Acidobacteria bacterium]|nr:MAG: cob(I)yrinic acid a,c-diamide adenosyltransferase [Acidobacteriota bacterium]